MPGIVRVLARSLDKAPFAPLAALMFASVAAILVMAMPGWMFSRALVAMGLAAAGAPPPGTGIQPLAAFLALACVFGFLSPVLALAEWLIRPRPAFSRGHRIEPHYAPHEPAPSFDAPTRRPLSASADLGAPFMSDAVIFGDGHELLLDVPAPDDMPQGHEEAAASSTELTVRDLLARLEKALERRTNGGGPALSDETAAFRDLPGGSELRH